MHVDAFEQLIIDVLDSLPPTFAQHLDNLEILVEDRPSPELLQTMQLTSADTIYGYYEGLPLTERSSYDLAMPSTITIFREPLETDFPEPEELRAEVRQTVLHELAHHFGISDARLLELGAY